MTNSNPVLSANFIPTRDQSDPPSILIVDDDLGSRRRLEIALRRLDVSDSAPVAVHSCEGIPGAFELLSRKRINVVLLDKDLGKDKDNPDHNGIESIPRFLNSQPHLQILMITGSKSTQDSARAIQLGAFGYVTKETEDELILAQIQRALALSEITIRQYQMARMQSAALPSATLGGSSPVFKQVLASAQLLAESNRPVLLLGESGTGKTVVARHIHDCRRPLMDGKEPPFLHINMAALAPDIVDRELFGHEKGAYTDAGEGKAGYFETAGNTGTLFFDEIGEASLALQATLLVAIETGEYRRLGATASKTARPKIILATNRNLEEMVRNKTMREDFYMRISAFPLRMPSLSERREDIPEIVAALLQKCCKQNNVFVEFKDIPPDFIDHLMKSQISGNIRGIEHQLDRLLIYSPRDSKRKPILKNWRGIPGLYLKETVTAVEPPRSRNSITLGDLKNKPFDLLGADFPGLVPFLKLMQSKLLEEAYRKFPINAHAAKAMGVTASYASRMRRGLEAKRPKPKPEKKSKRK